MYEIRNSYSLVLSNFNFILSRKYVWCLMLRRDVTHGWVVTPHTHDSSSTERLSAYYYHSINGALWVHWCCFCWRWVVGVRCHDSTVWCASDSLATHHYCVESRNSHTYGHPWVFSDMRTHLYVDPWLFHLPDPCSPIFPIHDPWHTCTTSSTNSFSDRPWGDPLLRDFCTFRIQLYCLLDLSLFLIQASEYVPTITVVLTEIRKSTQHSISSLHVLPK